MDRMAAAITSLPQHFEALRDPSCPYVFTSRDGTRGGRAVREDDRQAEVRRTAPDPYRGEPRPFSEVA